MENLKKKIGGLIITGAVAALSVSSAFAETTITSYNSVNVDKGSYVSTLVSQSDNIIKAKGGNITITSLDENKIDRGSVVETGVFTNNTEIDAAGKNIDIITGKTLTVDRGSFAGTVINNARNKIRTYTK